MSKYLVGKEFQEYAGDYATLVKKIVEKYGGKCVGVLENNEIIVEDSFAKLYEVARGRRIVTFHTPPPKGRMFAR